jgi:hypothetical protein
MGLITATDIQGEKPQHLHRELNLRREEMVVRDIMTPYDRLEVIYLEDVLTATVGDIVATLRSVSRRHALVLDNDPRSGRPAIRGIFSITQIGNQMGRVIDIAELAHTFAEVEMVLNS